MEQPWKNSIEYYDLQSHTIYNNPNSGFYHRGYIGNSDIEFSNYIIKEAGIKKGDNVVDLGCGSGYLTNQISNICKVEGITNSPKNLEYCVSKYPQNNFTLSDMENYKGKNKTHCLALESFNYTNYKTTFKNVYKVLKLGGIFFLKEWNGLEKESKKAKESRLYWEKFWCYKAPKTSKIIKLAEECGFKLVHNKNLDKIFNKINYHNTWDYHDPYIYNYNPPHPKTKFTIPVQLKFKKI